MTTGDHHACRICGRTGPGLAFDAWVRPTFTDWDKLQSGDVICNECAFWFDEHSMELARVIGKEKPQRMRNYSHFIIDGKWLPLSKAHKAMMQQLLLSKPFPELAAIAESGQKHIAFRAIRNPPGATAGWVQFEEHTIWVEPEQLASLLDIIQALYTTFSKTEIGSGSYRHYHILKFGLSRWQALESSIRDRRRSALFQLALFLAQKGENPNDDSRI